ncbi:hypothetical protein EV356DRAFT_453073 [Viridothelium virens]|uniref:Tafazzin n=1 Tax=Viridothelium virens TaxID=1048519 RepID=A0A6A6GZ57_VIRVR|nr:hypothetical protein EV356DRAFT_453073 [Viridothelium virens]
MPKKHNQNFNLSKTRYVHPSLTSTKENHGEASSGPSPGVNERLNQLRLSQSPKASPEKVDQITAAVTQKSVPPNLRAVLNIPEPAAPRPKPGVRRRRLPGQPAGPAAPQSWMERSQHAPSYERARARKRARYSAAQSKTRFRPPDVDRLPGVEMPKKGSLVEQALKTMAIEWEFVSEYEQLNLATIPARLKSALLSYLAAYGPETGITLGNLRSLFYTEEQIPGGTGTQDFKRLDLAGLIGRDLTLNPLVRYLANPDRPMSSTKRRSYGAESQKAELLESWDQEGLEISPALNINSFSAITHLSLARPDPNSPLLWSSLISLTSHLPTITHLSLAYWPAPSLTPNSNTASVHAKGSPRPVQLSGTGFYSHSLDEDYSEASNILRRLSLNTICLEWLDLEGCCDWWPALIWAICTDRSQRNESNARRTDAANEWSSQVPLGPDWNGPWRFICYIKLSQGWVPTNLTQATMQWGPCGVLRSLQGYLDRSKESGRDTSIEWIEDAGRLELSEWIPLERRAQVIKAMIQRTRNGGNIVEVDHGWTVS